MLIDSEPQAHETERFLENLPVFDSHRWEIERIQLLSQLAKALNKARHSRLVHGAVRERPPGGLGIALYMLVLLWGVGSAIGVLWDRSLLVWVFLSVGVLIGTFALAALLARVFGISPVRTGEATPGTLTLLWIAAAVVVGLSRGKALAWTHGIPLALALLMALVFRTLALREARDVALALGGVVRSAPYVAPVVLLVVLLPALTEDVWQLAATAKAGNMVGAAALSVGVLLLLVRRQLRGEFEPALATRCRLLAEQDDAGEQTRAALLVASDQEVEQLIRELPPEQLEDAWPVSGDEYAPYLAAAEGPILRRPLTARLLITTAVIGLLLMGYVYALLAATVPPDLAAGWTAAPVPDHKVSLLGLGVRLPGGTYVALAALLGIFATAIFLAFVVTEDRVAAAVTQSLLREPIDRFLVLALPFASLVEWALENGYDIESLSETQGEDEGGPSETPGEGGGEVSRSTSLSS